MSDCFFLSSLEFPSLSLFSSTVIALAVSVKYNEQTRLASRWHIRAFLIPELVLLVLLIFAVWDSHLGNLDKFP